MRVPILTPEQIKLYQEREVALDQLVHLREVLQGEVDLEPDEADAQITEHETAAILVAILEGKLQEINDALVAIKLGQYDTCERCQQPIETERLAAKPNARFCIACQQVVERAIHVAKVKQCEEDAFSSLATSEF